MFCLEHLHTLRQAEIGMFVREFPPGARVLEIGGGTGAQAKELAERGFDVVSIDIPDSNYATQRVFPVQDYDGRTLPFPDGSFDIVFSSNVLEHVPHLPDLQKEIARVLKPGGACVHILPSGAWRFWTSLAHYVELYQRAILTMKSGRPWRQEIRDVLALAKHSRLPPRHGERGNVATEIFYFSRFWWKRHFRRNRFDVIKARPMGIFYTGHMIAGKRWGLRKRQALAPLLGSACVLYTLKPKGTP